MLELELQTREREKIMCSAWEREDSVKAGS